MYYHIPTRSRIILLAALLGGCLVVASIMQWNGDAKSNRFAARGEQYKARLRDGLAGLVTNSPSSGESIRPAIEALSQVIQRRSGVRIGQETKRTLAALEERVLGGGIRRISGSELEWILSQVLRDRIGQLSDSDVEHAVDVLRGFSAPGLPEALSRGRSFIKPRASRGGPKVSDQLMDQIRTFRNNARTGDDSFAFLMLTLTSKEMESRLASIDAALPGWFARSGVDGGPSEVLLTPVQAILIYYSIVSDDNLLDSQINQERSMRSMRDFLASRYGRYPDPIGYHAYGVNGYIYSSPTDLFMDDGTLGRIFELYREKGQI